MGRFVRGEVVVVPFPFSDLSDVSKHRPALVIASLAGNDVILCQITSQQTHSDNYSVHLTRGDFLKGGLTKDCNIRPSRLFTTDSNIILSSEGEIKEKKLKEVIDMLTKILMGKA